MTYQYHDAVPSSTSHVPTMITKNIDDDHLNPTALYTVNKMVMVLRIDSI